MEEERSEERMVLFSGSTNMTYFLRLSLSTHAVILCRRVLQMDSKRADTSVSLHFLVCEPE